VFWCVDIVEFNKNIDTLVFLYILVGHGALNCNIVNQWGVSYGRWVSITMINLLSYICNDKVFY
jgi:hypothetical protein